MARDMHKDCVACSIDLSSKNWTHRKLRASMCSAANAITFCNAISKCAWLLKTVPFYFIFLLPNAAPVCNCLCIYLSTNLTRDLQGSNIGSCSGGGLAGGALAGSQTVLLAGGPGHAAAGHCRGQHVCTSIWFPSHQSIDFHGLRRESIQLLHLRAKVLRKDRAVGIFPGGEEMCALVLENNNMIYSPYILLTYVHTCMYWATCWKGSSRSRQ